MGMGHSACYGDVILTEKVKSTCPKEYAALEAVLMERNSTIDDFAAEIRFETPAVELQKVYEAIQLAFEKEYPGLELNLNYHDQESDGDRYDDVDGAFWEVSGLYTLTESAKKLGQGNWARCLWVHYC